MKPEPASVFRCPNCGGELQCPPSRCSQCMAVFEHDGIFEFTHEPDIVSEGEQAYVGYDDIAETYASAVHPTEIRDRLFKAYGDVLATMTRDDDVVLDLGCGPGQYASALAQHRRTVIAADISRRMLELLRDAMPDDLVGHLLPCRINAYRLPFRDQSMDAITAMQLLHFVGDPAWVIGEIGRVLRPGGALVIDGPHTNSTNPIDQCIRRSYRDGLAKQGYAEPSPPGWPSRHIHASLSQVFAARERIEPPALRFEFRTTHEWVFNRLERRYTMFQIAIPDDVHKEAIDYMRMQVNERFGSDALKSEQDYCWQHRFTVFREYTAVRNAGAPSVEP